jgi:APA family basic amino acid/polyamine antiporter
MSNSQPEHQPESQAGLVRRIGIVSATALVVSNMIGTGIFTTTGFLAGDLGSPAMVILIWVVGGAIALAGALCYVELALNFPRSGGEYVYLSEAWGPSWGFINGWISFFAGFSAPIAAAALAMSAYLGLSDGGRLVPLGLLTLHLGDAQLVACAVVAMFTLLNVLGVRDVGRLQTALTVLKLVIIGGLLVLGFSVGQGDPGHLSLATERTSDLSLFEQFAISLVFVFFAYSGWNAATYVAGEIQRPERTLPVALFIGTAGVTTLYVALNTLYVYAVSLEDLKGVIAVGATVASALFAQCALSVRGFTMPWQQTAHSFQSRQESTRSGIVRGWPSSCRVFVPCCSSFCPPSGIWSSTLDSRCICLPRFPCWVCSNCDAVPAGKSSPG